MSWAAEAKACGYRRVGVLGTRFTMGGSVYRDAARGPRHRHRLIPEADDFDTVDRIIFTELVDGIITDASREAYRGAIERLRERGCDAVALACTEIPLLVRPEDSSLPTLDSTRLLAAAAREAWLTLRPIATGGRDSGVDPPRAGGSMLKSWMPC